MRSVLLSTVPRTNHRSSNNNHTIITLLSHYHQAIITLSSHYHHTVTTLSLYLSHTCVNCHQGQQQYSQALSAAAAVMGQKRTAVLQNIALLQQVDTSNTENALMAGGDVMQATAAAGGGGGTTHTPTPAPLHHHLLTPEPLCHHALSPHYAHTSTILRSR
jgi:hypothetical protein